LEEQGLGFLKKRISKEKLPSRGKGAEFGKTPKIRGSLNLGGKRSHTKALGRGVDAR